MKYLISYDMKARGTTPYPKLIEEMESMNGYRVLFSQWVVIANGETSLSILNRLKPCLREGDRVLIINLDRLNDIAKWKLLPESRL